MNRIEEREKAFLQIVEEEKNKRDCEVIKFNTRDTSTALGGGVYSPQTTFNLHLSYKETDIVIYCEYGLQNVGLFKTKFKPKNSNNDFKIFTRSHLYSLFSPKKDRFKITPQHTFISTQINSINGFDELKKLQMRTISHLP